MTLEEMKEKAIQLMMKRFHWSQAVLAVGQEKLGRGGEEVIRAMGAFGGGLGGSGEACGALVGGLATIGLRFSRGREEEKEDPRMWAYAHELFDRFREEIVKKHGGITCREIAGVDWKDPDQVKSFYSGDKRLECRRIVGDAAKLVGELLERV